MEMNVSQHYIGNESINSVNARDVYEYLKVKTRFNDWMRRAIEKYDFIENEDYIALTQKRVTAQGNSIEQKDYIVSLDMAKELAMLENNPKGKQARKYFIKCEKQTKNNILTLPSNYKEALQHLLAKEEELEEAYKTKAYISDKKTATAMNTASQAVKKANKLEIELDKSKEYCTIKRMSMLNHGVKFNWRELKEISNLLNLEPIDVFDSNYGTVKAYHKDVWLEAYALEF